MPISTGSAAIIFAIFFNRSPQIYHAGAVGTVTFYLRCSCHEDLPFLFKTSESLNEYSYLTEV